MCNFNQKFTPYTTRHTFITRLAEKNVNPKVTMELAGHSCIETTLTYYTKSSSKILSNAILKPGMVFTVEPGIYIPEEGFGIRLEDDVVIQEKGAPLNLMKNIPIEVEEIEDIMNS